MAHRNKQWVDPKTLRRIVYMYFANYYKYERFQWLRKCHESDVDPRYAMAMVLSEEVQTIVQKKQNEMGTMFFNLNPVRDLDLEDYNLELIVLADRVSRFRFEPAVDNPLMGTLLLGGKPLFREVDYSGIHGTFDGVFASVSENIPDDIQTIPAIEAMLWDKVDEFLKVELIEWVRQTCLTKGVEFPSIRKQCRALRLWV